MTLGFIYGFLCGDCEGIPVESVLGFLFRHGPSPLAASPLYPCKGGGKPLAPMSHPLPQRVC